MELDKPKIVPRRDTIEAAVANKQKAVYSDRDWLQGVDDKDKRWVEELEGERPEEVDLEIAKGKELEGRGCCTRDDCGL